MENEINIKIDNGQRGNELADRIIDLINEYSDFFSAYELIGIIESVKVSCQDACRIAEDEEQ